MFYRNGLEWKKGFQLEMRRAFLLLCRENYWFWRLFSPALCIPFSTRKQFFTTAASIWKGLVLWRDSISVVSKGPSNDDFKECVFTPGFFFIDALLKCWKIILLQAKVILCHSRHACPNAIQTGINCLSICYQSSRIILLHINNVKVDNYALFIVINHRMTSLIYSCAFVGT